MNKLKFYLIDYEEILNNLRIVAGNLQEYLSGGREDILENFDIFCDNVRSKNKLVKKFYLFDKVDIIDDDCVIVLGLYLELLEFWGQREKIHEIVNYYCNKYPNNKIVVQWNHDSDASVVFNFIDDFKNLYVLNFNTSVRHERFIILPFWTIDDNLVINEKKYLANLVCSFNNNLMRTLSNTLLNKSNIYVSEKISFENYKKVLSESIFTFCPKGNGLSSYRFFESFHLNSIPVLIADDVILPYEDEINYNDFIIKINESHINDFDYILKKLNSVDYRQMLLSLHNVREKFTLSGVQYKVYRKLI